MGGGGAITTMGPDQLRSFALRKSPAVLQGKVGTEGKLGGQAPTWQGGVVHLEDLTDGSNYMAANLTIRCAPRARSPLAVANVDLSKQITVCFFFFFFFFFFPPPHLGKNLGGARRRNPWSLKETDSHESISSRLVPYGSHARREGQSERKENSAGMRMFKAVPPGTWKDLKPDSVQLEKWPAISPASCATSAEM